MKGRIRFYIFFWPFYQIFKLWNPLHITDRRSGETIKDIWKKRQERKNSVQERERRRAAGEEQKKWFSCRTIRSVDMSGGEG